MLKNAKNIQNLLIGSGYKTLAAGGFVRDTILGRKPKDIDLATAASPEKVKEILNGEGIKTIDTGLKHGTVTAVLSSENYEITTLRIDKQCFGRKAEVEYTKSFKEDAQRRDLTINALFMDLNTKQIYDYVDGKKDLDDKILRFVGNPDKRIKEDYLRILRFYRFASQLGFSMALNDKLTCCKYLSYLVYISPERIIEELRKILVGDNILSVFTECSDIFETLIPEIKPLINMKMSTTENPNLSYAMLERAARCLDLLKKYKDPTLSLTYLMSESATPLILNSVDKLPLPEHLTEEALTRNIEESSKLSDRFCSRYKLATQDTRRIKFLISHQYKLKIDMNDQEIRQLMSDCSEYGDKEIIFDLNKLYSTEFIDSPTNSISFIKKSGLDDLTERLQKIYSENRIDSPLSGKELIDRFSLKPGKLVGEVKSYLKNLVIEGSLDYTDKKKAYSLAYKYITS